MQQEKGKELLKKYLEGKASAEDQALLEAWYEQFEMKDRLDVAETEREERLDRVRNAIIKHSGRKQARIKKMGSWYRISAAAVLLIFLSAGLYFYLSKSHEIPVTTRNQSKYITPGNYRATLTLANGQKILITKSLRGLIAEQGSTVIKADNGQSIAYVTNGTETKAAYNTLSTVRGEQSPYPLILTDGTKVWLNAASSITFPTAFGGNDRVVKITGEALFQVAHNAAKPFRVICNGQIVDDIGTWFNINAYIDEPVIRTTLLEGKVKVSTSDGSALLKPGQQSVINNSGTSTAITVSDSVNTEQVLAWENGKFIFSNTDIKTVMRQVERWYNVEVEYDKGFMNATFSGGFSRSMDFSKVLRSLAFTGVDFQVKGRKIIVK
jgi:ferric-dicitrate binding protein FerR (iron transport regulator)